MKIELDEHNYLEVSRIKADVVLSLKSKKDNKSTLITLKLRKDDVAKLVSKLIILKSEQDKHEAS